MEAEIQQLHLELDDARHHIEELQTTHEEVTVEKLTYLSKVTKKSYNIGSGYLEIKVYVIK